MLHKLSFPDELKTVETPKTFKVYATSCSIELIKDKDGTTKDTLNNLQLVNQVLKTFLEIY